MASICYSWDDTPFMWMETPFTWKEACVIEKLVNYGTTKVKDRIKKLDDEERQVIIDLFMRLEVDEIVFEKKINKHKNSKVKIKLKDFDVTPAVQKNINVNIKIKD